MKVYYFPYGIGEIIAVPSSKTLVVKFPEVTVTISADEAIKL